MNYMTIDGKKVSFNGERNILEVVRKAGIEIPTFCYHSELSVYGACRLCLVDVEGRGIQASCSIIPENGMVVRTNTAEIRNMRKITIELLLASYDHDCLTCSKSSNCKLQDIAYKLGVQKVRFKRDSKNLPIDNSSHSLTRDPNKCILCGDCVRACDEIQGIGVIDFVNRGKDVAVLPAFGKDLAKVDCIDCGQCARVCPTGALLPKSEIEKVWKEIDNKDKTVVAQIAPAVRVAIGEMFGLKPGTILTGQIVAALKMLGFDKVYDTSFAADLTIIEEANEFIKRKTENVNLPQFTSCCPGWVKYAEQYHPELFDNLSTCKSPQQMFGSVAKEILPEALNTKSEDLVVVSIMPCTAKKFEAKRPEFQTDGVPDVDHVITTQELGRMIKEAGISFTDLDPEPMDMPLGFKTGAGVIFGNSGGVSEAVLRYAYEKVKGEKLENAEFIEVRGMEGLRECKIELNDIELKIAIVHSLKNAKTLIRDMKDGKVHYDFVEVMSCPGGCVCGAGQPSCYEDNVVEKRAAGLYKADKSLQLHKPQQNPYIQKLYAEHLGEINGHKAHELLHTEYTKRKRIINDGLNILNGNAGKVDVSVCVGTSCFVKGSQKLLQQMLKYVEEKNISDIVNIKANFCYENCDKGPSVTIGGKLINKCNFDIATRELENALMKIEAEVNA